MTNMTNEEQQKHEAAIQAWHGKVANALAAVDIGYVRDRGTPGDRAFEELFRLADDAVKLARRAPRPEPKPGPRAPSEVEQLLTNAEREEAILRWLREAKVWPQDSSIGQPGYWLGEEHLEQAAILFRGGPANEPRPSSALLEAAKATVEGLGLPEHLRYGEWLTTTLGKLYLAIKAEEARGTEPRASSPLLEAVLNIHKLDSLLNDALNEQVRRAQEGK
jgi:hypothetical protein